MNRFRTTRWSLVLGARGTSQASARALDELCRIYRPPVLAYVRSRGHADAEDLTQAFFEQLLRLQTYAVADPGRGRFRVFLRVALKHFLSNQIAAAHAAKRGGGQTPLSFEHDCEGVDAADAQMPDEVFERAWADAVLRQSLVRLDAEAAAAGKRELFLALRPFLLESPDADGYARIAERLNLRRNTVAVAIHRLRARLHEAVREELGETVAGDTEVESELEELQAALARPRAHPV
jgi:RNA polymerase sigma factor (sigma-70 family)